MWKCNCLKKEGTKKFWNLWDTNLCKAHAYVFAYVLAMRRERSVLSARAQSHSLLYTLGNFLLNCQIEFPVNVIITYVCQKIFWY